jgi:hypothetical protein
MSGEYLDMVQTCVQKNLDGMDTLMRCRTLPELWAAQGALVRDNLELTLSNSRRIAEVSTRLADTTKRSITVQAERSTRRAA